MVVDVGVEALGVLDGPGLMVWLGNDVVGLGDFAILEYFLEDVHVCVVLKIHNGLYFKF